MLRLRADLHRAYVATQLAAHAVTQGNGVRALALIGPHIDRAARSVNAVLVSTSYCFALKHAPSDWTVLDGRATALVQIGRCGPSCVKFHRYPR